MTTMDRRPAGLLDVAKAEKKSRVDATSAGLLGAGTASIGAGVLSNRITYKVNSAHRNKIDRRLTEIGAAHGVDSKGRPTPKLHVPSHPSSKNSGKKMAQAMARASSDQERAAIREQMAPKPHPNSAANKESYQRKVKLSGELRASRNVPRISDAARNKGRYGAFTAGSLGLWQAGRRMADDDDVKKYERRDADVAAMALPAGVVAYQAPGHIAGSRERKKHYPKIAESPELNEIRARHRKKHNIPANAEKDHPNWHKYHKTYPKELPGSKLHRLTARTHTGPAGIALTGAAGLGAASMAVNADRKLLRSKDVKKNLYAKEERLSPTRAAQFGIGATLGAIGLGRSRMVGRALGRGAKMADMRGNAQVAEAIRRAEAARGALRTGTAPTAAALRKIRHVEAAVNRVPRGLRGDVSLAVGALLAGNSLPMRNTTYRPVGTPVRYSGRY